MITFLNNPNKKLCINVIVCYLPVRPLFIGNKMHPDSLVCWWYKIKSALFGVNWLAIILELLINLLQSGNVFSLLCSEPIYPKNQWIILCVKSYILLVLISKQMPCCRADIAYDINIIFQFSKMGTKWKSCRIWYGIRRCLAYTTSWALACRHLHMQC